MRSFGRCVAAIAVIVMLLPTAPRAQSTQAAELYQQALARETTLRKQVDATSRSSPAAGDLLTRMRTLAGTYEDLWRLFPTSGYSDNALWQGAKLSADAFLQFGDPADRTTALRLFQALTRNFPTSSLLKQVPAQVSRLEAVTGRAPAGLPTPATTGATTPAPATPAPSPTRTAPPPATTPSTTPSTLIGIRREVLPDALRVTLELEREPIFHAERIEGPPRVFIDLQNTRASAAVRDAQLPYKDDVVRQIRVGRQLNGRIRVVLDLSGAGNYSVYSLYNPYRIIIDFERRMAAPPGLLAASKPANAGATLAPPPVASAPAPVSTSVTPPTPRPESRPTVAVPAAADARLKTGPTTEAPAAAPVPPAANSTGTFSLSRQLGLGIARIVIDAGHGGHDPGAKVRGLTEAELTLDIALRLEKLLAKQSGVDVVLTRRSDAYVPLEERTAIANESGADLFLSIHANASDAAAARGIETYFLNFAPNPEAEAIAARENASSSKTMRNLPDIVKAIAMNNKIDESRDFATMVQSSLHDKLRGVNKQIRNLGVKQAPFMVLIGATMPSILSEISFLTNKQEGALLKTEKYRQQIAEALFEGVMRYQQSLKKAPAVALGATSTPR
jgi:N-acetylmuramoyl-L-alanine amidase